MTAYPFARIDLAALRDNLQRVRQFAPESKIMSVIKADAYGHGVIEIAQALSDSDAFAVARLAEAIALRQQGIQQPVVVLEGVETAAALQAMSAHDLSPVFNRPEQVKLALSTPLNKPLTLCWLMVESGMHRLGITANQVGELVDALDNSESITGRCGLMSHFANADLVNDPRNQQQLDIIEQLAEQTGQQVCFANSAAVMAFKASHQQWVRPGLMLYGISPFAGRTAVELGLKPVMTLKAELIAIHQLREGEQVGYGGTFTAEKNMRVAVVNIGYGDGYSRHLSNSGLVSVRGRQQPIIGRISMDSLCISLQGCEQAEVGDEVVLWGDQSLWVEQVAVEASTIPYELVSAVSERVQRVYRSG